MSEIVLVLEHFSNPSAVAANTRLCAPCGSKHKVARSKKWCCCHHFYEETTKGHPGPFTPDFEIAIKS